MKNKFKKVDIDQLRHQTDYIDIKIGDWRIDDVLVSECVCVLNNFYGTSFALKVKSYYTFNGFDRFFNHDTNGVIDKPIDVIGNYKSSEGLFISRNIPGHCYTTKRISNHDTIKIRPSKAARKRFKQKQKEWHQKLDDVVHDRHNYAKEDELSKMLQEKFCEVKLK